MTSAELCMLCASGEHRPESHELRTMTLFVMPIGNDELSLAVIEHYRVIDERLPYERRFRTEHYTLEVYTGIGLYTDTRLSVEITEPEVLQLTVQFLNAVVAMRETR